MIVTTGLSRITPEKRNERMHSHQSNSAQINLVTEPSIGEGPFRRTTTTQNSAERQSSRQIVSESFTLPKDRDINPTEIYIRKDFRSTEESMQFRQTYFNFKKTKRGFG